MAYFNFKLPKKKDRKRVTKRIGNKNVKGIIHISINGNYHVVDDNGVTYNINSSNFSCKNKEKIYRQGMFDKNNFCYIRSIDNRHEKDKNFWIPFGIGCVVVGDVIFDENDIPTFDIKECNSDYNSEQSKEAIRFYKEHLIEINNAIRKRQ